MRCAVDCARLTSPGGWAMPYATRDGLRLAYEVVGTGPPLLLHPPITGAGANWASLGYVDAFKDEYTLILFDPLGHGHSDKPRDPAAYGAAERAADALAVLDAAG